MGRSTGGCCSAFVEWDSAGLEKDSEEEEWCSFNDRDIGVEKPALASGVQANGDAPVRGEESQTEESQPEDASDDEETSVVTRPKQKAKAKGKSKAKGNASAAKKQNASGGYVPEESDDDVGASDAQKKKGKGKGKGKRRPKGTVASAETINAGAVVMKKRASGKRGGKRGSGSSAGVTDADAAAGATDADAESEPPPAPAPAELEEAAKLADEAAEVAAQVVEEEETHQEKEDGQGPGSGESGSSPDASKHAAAAETGPTTAQLEQKKKVQVMVKEFVNIAVGGVRCTYVDFQSGGMAKATYFIDSKIQTFRVTLDGDQGEFSCEFTKILEAQCYGDLGVQLPSIQRIPVEDQKRALLIECQGPQQAAQWLCILEETREKAERFVTCVEILKMYAAVRSSDGPAPSTPTV